MGAKMEDSPCSFRSSQETAINVVVNFIMALNLKDRAIMPLEDVFVDILHQANLGGCSVKQPNQKTQDRPT